MTYKGWHAIKTNQLTNIRQQFFFFFFFRKALFTRRKKILSSNSKADPYTYGFL